ncbi:MAG: hypothetical protein IPQ04_03390 [Saprospiraceae bacterium]|nr:hypothetical protein [Saprospiraceae bacterium]
MKIINWIITHFSNIKFQNVINAVVLFSIILVIGHCVKDTGSKFGKWVKGTKFVQTASENIDYIDGELKKFEKKHNRKMIYCGRYFLDSIITEQMIDTLALSYNIIEKNNKVKTIPVTKDNFGKYPTSAIYNQYFSDNTFTIYCCCDGITSILYSIGPNGIDEEGLGDDYVQGTPYGEYVLRSYVTGNDYLGW